MDYQDLRWYLALLLDSERVSRRDILHTLIRSLAMVLAFLAVTAVLHAWGHSVTLGALLASFALMLLAILLPDEKSKRERRGLEGWLISSEKQTTSWFFLGLTLLFVFFIYGMLATVFMWPV